MNLRQAGLSLKLTLLLAGALLTVPARADVTLPSFLSDHMLVQRDRPVRVWGLAGPDEAVRAEFRGASASTHANAWGEWQLFLPPGGAGGPFTLTVSARNRIEIHDVLVGDLWLASGQSNMEFPLVRASGGEQAVASAHDPSLRVLRIEKTVSDYPREDTGNSGWAAESPERVKDFSAVAWYFGHELRDREQVPIGLIDASWGGTPGEAWISPQTLGSERALQPVFADRASMVSGHQHDQRLAAWEQRQIDAAKAAGKTPPGFPWHPPLNTWAPGALYNAMIAPLTRLPIKGVIWYQGEANTGLERAPHYADVFRALIDDWRLQWRQSGLPFLFVQLANFTSGPHEDWATVREAQRAALDLAHTGMAVTIDIGNPDDVHPLDKKSVGHRLALAARHRVYGESLEDSGPTLLDVARVGSSLRLRFSHADGLKTVGTLDAFEIAGSDGHYAKASARIDGDSIIVQAADVTQPEAVRYAWANAPHATLFNAAGLPASPFRASLN